MKSVLKLCDFSFCKPVNIDLLMFGETMQNDFILVTTNLIHFVMIQKKENNSLYYELLVNVEALYKMHYQIVMFFICTDSL